MKILLLGAHGQLGTELKKILPELGELTALSRKELDLTNLSELKIQLNSLKPAIIINSSAYTAVDKAEKEIDLANLINAKVPEILAQYSADNNAILVHYSTDYVFDGKQTAPYIETDEPNPLSIYGLSKLIGEQKILEKSCKHLIFRTSWLFSAHGQNFLTTILKLAKTKDELRVIADQIGNPTSCEWLAKITLQSLNVCISKLKANEIPPWGIYHATNRSTINWYEYSKYIIDLFLDFGGEPKIQLQNIIPIETAELHQIATRPQFSSLSSAKLAFEFDIEIVSFKPYLAKSINQYIKLQ
jgi:dTDP-4-dehydrorhamnose reductase